MVSETSAPTWRAARRRPSSVTLGSVRIGLVAHYASLVVVILSGTVLAIAAWSAVVLWMGEEGERNALIAFLAAGTAGLVAGGGIWMGTRSQGGHFGRREAILLVSMSWLVGAGLASVPYLLWAYLSTDGGLGHPFRDPVNCCFEAVSGLTTPGASILPDIESLPRSLVLWRSTTHWIGGLGIILLFAAVLPGLGVTAKRMVRAESPSTLADSREPSTRRLARSLWIIYTGITLAGIIGLRFAGGMGWFDAVIHSFAALATGGFSTRNANTGAFTHLGALAILIALMILGGVNFRLYYHLVRGRFRTVYKDRELRLYLALLTVTSSVALLSLTGMPIVLTTGAEVPPSDMDAITHGLFNVVSMHTDTGFATADFDRWSGAALAVICFGTFVGGCAGSTTGGIKVVRLLLVAKIMVAHVQHYLPSKRVCTLRLGHRIIDKQTQERVLVHVFLFGLVLIGGAIGLTVLESPGDIGLKTAATAALATLCTAGPGLGKVGPVHNYLWFSASSKILMSFLMILGRLELLTFLALLSPRFWRSD